MERIQETNRHNDMIYIAGLYNVNQGIQILHLPYFYPASPHNPSYDFISHTFYFFIFRSMFPSIYTIVSVFYIFLFLFCRFVSLLCGQRSSIFISWLLYMLRFARLFQFIIICHLIVLCFRKQRYCKEFIQERTWSW